MRGGTSTAGARLLSSTSPHSKLPMEHQTLDLFRQHNQKAGENPYSRKLPGLFSPRLTNLVSSQRLRAEQQPSHRTAHTRNQQEKPHLSHRLAANQQRRSQAARRVHAYTGHVDAKDVNGHQRNADREARKPCRRTLLRRTKNYDHEDQRRHKLKKNRGSDVIAALVTRAPAVLAESAEPDVVAPPQHR